MSEQMRMQVLDRAGQERPPATFSARRNVEGVTARPGTGTFNRDTAAGIRSDGNSGTPGSPGSSVKQPRTSSIHHHSRSRPSANMYASR